MEREKERERERKKERERDGDGERERGSHPIARHVCHPRLIGKTVNNIYSGNRLM